MLSEDPLGGDGDTKVIKVGPTPISNWSPEVEQKFKGASVS